jgi:hypothetical protein
MIDIDLSLSIGEYEKGVRTTHSSAEELDRIERRLVCPLGVFEYEDRRT